MKQQVTEKKVGENEIEILTNEYVGKLNERFEGDARLWIETGRIIAEYIDRIGKSEGDAFKYLSQHPDILFTASHLRNYYAAFILHEAMQKESPNVSFTHFITVLGHSLNLDSKIAFLMEAEEEGLSVSQLKHRIKTRNDDDDDGSDGDDQTDPTNDDGEFKKETETMFRVIEKMNAQLDKYSGIRSSRRIPTKVKADFLILVRNLVSAGYVKVDDIIRKEGSQKAV